MSGESPLSELSALSLVLSSKSSASNPPRKSKPFKSLEAIFLSSFRAESVLFLWDFSSLENFAPLLERNPALSPRSFCNSWIRSDTLADMAIWADRDLFALRESWVDSDLFALRESWVDFSYISISTIQAIIGKRARAMILLFSVKWFRKCIQILLEMFCMLWFVISQFCVFFFLYFVVFL